jgi:hypothetical protein
VAAVAWAMLRLRPLRLKKTALSERRFLLWVMKLSAKHF